MMHSGAGRGGPSVLHFINTGTHPWHVLHENGESLLIVVPQTAVVLNDALVMQILQELDFAL